MPSIKFIKLETGLRIKNRKTPCKRFTQDLAVRERQKEHRLQNMALPRKDVKSPQIREEKME